MNGKLSPERCAEVRRFCDTYLDGEFGESERTEFEGHIAVCDPCRAIVKQQSDWRAAFRKVAPRETAPLELVARVRERLDVASGASPSWRRFAQRVLPYAAAAGLALTWAASRLGGPGWSAIAADAVAKHQRNLPLEVTGGSEQVRRWYAGKVDFPVRPPEFQRARSLSQIALKGGRLANIRDQQAAYLQYEFDGARVSVFIFDAAHQPVSSQRMHRIGNREVFFEGERGYNVALYQDRGVGYAVAGDLSEDQLIQLVSSAVESR